jgi:hypothetical protein
MGIIMNNGTQETSQADRPGGPTRAFKTATNIEELSQLKRDLLRAEVRLGKARATVVGAELDIKVLNAKLKALAL